MELMEHQKEAVEKLHNGSILYGDVGTGKTLTALAYYMKNESPKDIYIITTAKLRDSLYWEGEAAKFGIGTERDATLAGVLTVDSWNNIGKYTEIEDGFFVLDEQRLVGSGAWVKSFLKIAKNNNWIMATGTPGDSYMDYIAVFIANGFFKNRTEFLREHCIFAPFSKYPKIVGYQHVSTLEKYRNMLLVEAPYIKTTKRNIEYVETSYDIALLNQALKDRWNVYENRPIKDVSELFRIMRRIVSSDPSRLDALRELMEKHPKLIIFYNYNYELEILRTLCEEITIAEYNGHKHEALPNTDRWLYLVQYVAGAEGWNCIETDAIVFWSLTYSWKNLEQAKGRIDRLDTEFIDLYYYIFVSNSIVDRAVRASLESKKLFNEVRWSRENL